MIIDLQSLGGSLAADRCMDAVRSVGSTTKSVTVGVNAFHTLAGSRYVVGSVSVSGPEAWVTTTEGHHIELNTHLNPWEVIV